MDVRSIVSNRLPLTKRHPFSGRREPNTRAARERDAWIETARHYAQGESYWRERAEKVEKGTK